MISGFIITFRETLEAALIVGIVLAYLAKANQQKYNRFVWWGVVSGIIVSILGTVILGATMGEFEGRVEEIFEGTLMFIAAILLSIMILWMARQGKYVRMHLESQVAKEIKEEHAVGILALIFFAVLREGIETVIFLGAASRVEVFNILGPGVGIIVALILGYLIFLGARKIQLKWFFWVTSLILIVFASGLVAHGVHEFQEAGIIPIFIEHIWDINHIINEKGTLGSILKALFGYNANPSLIEVITWAGYLVIFLNLYRTITGVNTKESIASKV